MNPADLAEMHAVFQAAVDAFEKREDARLLCARLSFRLATRHRHSRVTGRLLEDAGMAMRDAWNLDGGSEDA